MDAAELAAESKKRKRIEKERKAAKGKSKKVKLDEEGNSVERTTVEEVQKSEVKVKKSKKSSSLSKPQDEDGDATEDPQSKPTTTQPDQPSKNRFIAFVGNLPYNTTTESLNRHFHGVRPDSIRHLTEKPKPGAPQDTVPKSKGYAFLEFTSYDRLKTCLKLYHHSLFAVDEDNDGPEQVAQDDSAPPVRHKKRDIGGRRINVELTAGGGGTSAARMEKLRVKNERLSKQRERQFLVEQEEGGAGKKRRGGGLHEEEGFEGGNTYNADAGGDAEEGEEGDGYGDGVGDGDMHPSRLAMMNDPKEERGGFGGDRERRGGGGRGRGGRGDFGGRGRGRGGSGGRARGRGGGWGRGRGGGWNESRR